MPFAACMIEKGTVFYDNVQRYFQVQLYGELVQRQYSRRLIALALAFALGLFIFLIYKKPMLELCILQDLGLRSWL